MVEHDVMGVLHIQWRHAATGQVASTEANMADDDVGLVQFHLIAGYTDATAWCRLSGNGDVRMVQRQFRCQVDGAAGAEEDGTWRVVAGLQRPAQGALHQVVVSTVVVAGDIIHLGPTAIYHSSTRGEAAVALGTWEGDKVSLIVVYHGKDSQDGAVFIECEGIGRAGRQFLAVAVHPAHKIVALIGGGRQRQRGAGIILTIVALLAHAHRSHACRCIGNASGQRGLRQFCETSLHLHVGCDVESMRILRRDLCATLIPALEGIANVGRRRAGDIIARHHRCRSGVHRAGSFWHYRCRKRAGLHRTAQRGGTSERHVAHSQVGAVVVAADHTHHHLPGIVAGGSLSRHVECHVVIQGTFLRMTVHLTQFIGLAHLSAGIQFTHQHLEGRI